MDFVEARLARAERLVSDADLCDGSVLLGVERQRVPCHRALLANASEPLRKAFYGDFQESTTREVALPEVTAAAFRCVARATASLDPQLDASNVVQTLHAAKMYMMADLVSECEHYLKVGITPETVLTVMTACLAAGVTVPVDVEVGYWALLLEHSTRVLESASFLQAHGTILVRLLKLDEFGVSEEALWTRLVQWAANVRDHQELWAPIVEDHPGAASEAKRPKLSGDSDRQVDTILHQFAKRLRLLRMGTSFFVDNVSQYLTREDSESILTHHLLKRPLPDRMNGSTRARKGLRPPEELLFISVSSTREKQAAERLPQCDAPLAPGTQGGTLPALNGTLLVETAEPVILTKICITFAAQGEPWPFQVSTILNDHCSGSISADGRLAIWTRTLTTQCYDRQWKVNAAVENVGGVSAPLTRMECFGKKAVRAYAGDFVKQHSADLFLLQRPPPDSN